MASCMTPLTLKNKISGQSIAVPCGRCPACYSRRVSAWSFRLMQEEKISISAHFITLTYDTSTIPITNKGFISLSKRDAQLFFKRLRKANKGRQLKYYLVGEYGGKTHRPHYHILLFNVEIKTIIESWGNGNVHYGDLNGASVGYCLKYMSKTCKIGKFDWDDRLPSFALMSKGLGKNYLTDAIKKWHHADKLNRMYVNLLDGKKVSMPRYYKDKLYHETERKAIGFHQRQKMLEQQEKFAENPDYEKDKVASTINSFRKLNLILNDKI